LLEAALRERALERRGKHDTDAGQSHARLSPYPCRRILHGANQYGLRCLRNLDELLPTGALIISAPLKIQGGSANSPGCWMSSPGAAAAPPHSSPDTSTGILETW